MSRRGACVVALVLGAAACGPRPSGGRQSRLEVVVPTEASTLDPRFSTRSLDMKITRLVHAGLVGLDPNTLEPFPLVARELHFTDERTLEITLKPGVVFHGGQPLSPNDVCATLDAVRDPLLRSPHRTVVEAIGSCEPRGADGVTLKLAEPRATLLTDLEIPILRADEARSAPRPAGDLDGLGPYTIVSSTPSEVTLEPAFTNVVPRPATGVVIRTVRDENARVARLLAGRSDVAPNDVSPMLLPVIDGKEGLEIVARPGSNVTYLLLDNDRAPFGRANVRRAIAESIDRELIVRTLLSGRATVADSLIPPGHWAHVDVPKIPFSPDTARPVLTGLEPVTLLTSTDRSRVTLARAVAQMLGDAGLSTLVVPLDAGALFSRLDAGDYDMAILQIPEFTEPNLLRWFFHPSAVPGEGGQGKNRARYRSAEVARLLDDAAEVADRARRAVDYREVSELMARDLPVIPLFHEDQVAVVSARARGFVPSAEGRWLGLAGLK